MSETLRETIEDIQRKLRAGAYQNEEHVRLSLVARVVQALGWDIWNPREVHSEFAATPAEDRTKVDMALFAVANLPSVFIEIKAVGKLDGNLEAVETQVRDYTRNITTPFAIITDGRLWRFYYVKGDGTFSQKLFDTLDLLEVDAIHAARTFETILSKAEIRSGNAESVAKQRLNVTQKQVEMANCFEAAKERTGREPFPNLPTALIEEMRLRGYDVTLPEGVAFIRSKQNQGPTSPTTLSAMTQYMPSAKAGSRLTEGGGDTASTKSSPRRPKALRLNGDLIPLKKSNQILISTAEFLVAQGKIHPGCVPLALGKTSYLINHEPRNAAGREFDGKHRLSNGLWLDTNFSSAMSEEKSKKLLSHFGFQRDLLEVIWE